MIMKMIDFLRKLKPSCSELDRYLANTFTTYPPKATQQLPTKFPSKAYRNLLNPVRYWPDAASIGPVPTRLWYIEACSWAQACNSKSERSSSRQYCRRLGRWRHPNLYTRIYVCRADSRSQWETSLQSNAISHWRGANLESALCVYESATIFHGWVVMALDSDWDVFLRPGLIQYVMFVIPALVTSSIHMHKCIQAEFTELWEKCLIKAFTNSRWLAFCSYLTFYLRTKMCWIKVLVNWLKLNVTQSVYKELIWYMFRDNLWFKVVRK